MRIGIKIFFLFSLLCMFSSWAYLSLSVFIFAVSTRNAENELLLPLGLHLHGRVRCARHSSSTALTSPPPPTFHHLVGGSSDQGLHPGFSCLHLPRRPPMGEKLWGTSKHSRPLLPLSGVHHSPLAAGPIHCWRTVGMALLGTGEWVRLLLSVQYVY